MCRQVCHSILNLKFLIFTKKWSQTFVLPYVLITQFFIFMPTLPLILRVVLVIGACYANTHKSFSFLKIIKFVILVSIVGVWLLLDWIRDQVRASLRVSRSRLWINAKGFVPIWLFVLVSHDVHSMFGWTVLSSQGSCLSPATMNASNKFV